MIILDLDNTISNDEWRTKRIDWKEQGRFLRYHDYHQLAAFDEAENHHLYNQETKPIAIFTARPVHYRALTEEWLERKGVNYKLLMMRPDNDHSHSVLLKARMLEQLQKRWNVVLQCIVAYDDRPEVVEMYKKAGVAEAHCVCIHHRTEFKEKGLKQ